jgi:hypothetical protein
MLSKLVIDGKVGGKRRRRNRNTLQQLLSDFKEKRGYWELKQEAVARTLWGTRFGRGCGTVVGRKVSETII